MLLCSVLAGMVTYARTVWQQRRRKAAREDEIALLAATVQRWRLTPAEWGGADGTGFEGVSLEAIGATVCPLTGQRRTANGIYSVVHVPAGPVLDRALARVGRDGGTDGVLVIGRDPETYETSSAIVLGPLLQVPLATVPWHLAAPAVALEEADYEQAVLEAEEQAPEDAPTDLEVASVDTSGVGMEVVEPTAAVLEAAAPRRQRDTRRRRAPDRVSESLTLTLWPPSTETGPPPSRGPTSIRWPRSQPSRGRREGRSPVG